MHRLSSAARRSLILALGSLTALFVALNFGVFLNQAPLLCENEARVIVADDVQVSVPSEAELQRIEEEMARVEVEMRRVERDLREMELKGVQSSLDAARDAMVRKEIHLKLPSMPSTLTREGSLHIQLQADELQLN